MAHLEVLGTVILVTERSLSKKLKVAVFGSGNVKEVSPLVMVRDVGILQAAQGFGEWSETGLHSSWS